MHALSTLIGQSDTRLTAADQAIARILLDDPDVSAMLTAQQVAARAKVHEAAATRFAQKLGFKGYPELRLVLQKDVLSGRDAASRLENSVTRMRERGFLSSLVDDEIAALRAAQDSVPPERVAAAANQLWAAPRIFLFARGHASALAQLAERRLRRFGKATVTLHGEPRDVAEAFHGCMAQDVVLAFAFRRTPGLLEPVLTTAAERSANVILICDPLIAAHNPRAGLVLAAPRGRPDHEFQTLSVPMALLNAIILAMGAAPLADPALEEVESLIARFEAK
jgi:DNA-binding MurR/RpiR family transcriptional regulator